MKQYHDELNADMKEIKGSMAMLGDTPEGDEPGDEDESAPKGNEL